MAAGGGPDDTDAAYCAPADRPHGMHTQRDTRRHAHTTRHETPGTPVAIHTL